jgi:tRNA (cytidine/uridine-2'-O-)-methyltransferase
MNPQDEEVAVFAKKGEKFFWDMPRPQRLFLIFGSETRELRETILSLYKHATYHIPISRDIRCLNLSTAAGTALYESLRVSAPFHAWGE